MLIANLLAAALIALTAAAMVKIGHRFPEQSIARLVLYVYGGILGLCTLIPLLFAIYGAFAPEAC